MKGPLGVSGPKTGPWEARLPEHRNRMRRESNAGNTNEKRQRIGNRAEKRRVHVNTVFAEDNKNAC